MTCVTLRLKQIFIFITSFVARERAKSVGILKMYTEAIFAFTAMRDVRGATGAR